MNDQRKVSEVSQKSAPTAQNEQESSPQVSLNSSSKNVFTLFDSAVNNLSQATIVENLPAEAECMTADDSMMESLEDAEIGVATSISFIRDSFISVQTLQESTKASESEVSVPSLHMSGHSSHTLLDHAAKSTLPSEVSAMEIDTITRKTIDLNISHEEDGPAAPGYSALHTFSDPRLSAKRRKTAKGSHRPGQFLAQTTKRVWGKCKRSVEKFSKNGRRTDTTLSTDGIQSQSLREDFEAAVHEACQTNGSAQVNAQVSVSVAHIIAAAKFCYFCENPYSGSQKRTSCLICQEDTEHLKNAYTKKRDCRELEKALVVGDEHSGHKLKESSSALSFINFIARIRGQQVKSRKQKVTITTKGSATNGGLANVHD
ncbi:hypothetical protein OXX59_005108 [Metschnikowia pulcherrima]